MSRIWFGLMGAAALLIAPPLAAQPDKGGQAEHKHHEQQKAGGEKKAKHNHKANNGHNLLGAKLKQDGKHAVGKFKDREVMAEVKGGKVHNMTAGDLQAKRVRTKAKMAASDGGLTLASWNGQLQLAQYETYYYGYCFDDGIDFDCYWYPADDVDYQDYAWEDYDPYY